MIVGFDGKRPVSNMTGLGNYSRLVIEQLATRYLDNHFKIYAPKLKPNPRLLTIRKLPNVEFIRPRNPLFSGALWRTFGIPGLLKKDHVDIYHGLSNELPLNIASSSVPSVVTIHDVIYRRLPECYSPFDRRMYDFKYGRSCHNSTRIIAVSQCTKNDIVDIYGVNPDKIDVVYQGCDDSFRRDISQEELAETRSRLHLPERYILQVGTVESRKNLELTVRALATLPSDVWLVAVGRDREGYMGHVRKIAEELGVAGRILFIENIAFADLPAVNRLAEVIAYPSHYEGFGIPVLEGLESCRPVVAATGSCLEEAGGDAAIYVDPNSPRQMGEALNAILSGSAPVDRMIAAGKRHAAKFDTSMMASEIMKTYDKAIAEYGRKQVRS